MDTQRPALTPGGGTGPSPCQGRHCGAVPRNRLQGPRTKRPHWGRRASERRPGREITFWGPSGCFLSARSLYRRDPPLAKGVCWSPTQRPPPASGSIHICPSFSQLHWAGQATRLPSARLQHKAGPGEGNGHSRSTCVEAARPPAIPRTDTRPSAGSTTSAQKLGFCGSLAFWGQLPRTSRCQLGPAPLRQPTETPRAPPPPAGPVSPRSSGPRSLANALARSRAGSAAPKLAFAEGPGLRGTAGLV